MAANKHFPSIAITVSPAALDALKSQAESLDLPLGTMLGAIVDGAIETGQVLRLVTKGMEGRPLHRARARRTKHKIAWVLENPGLRKGQGAGGRLDPGIYTYLNGKWRLYKPDVSVSLWLLTNTWTGETFRFPDVRRIEAQRVASETVWKEEHGDDNR